MAVEIFLHGIRWRLKYLPQCKRWRAFVFAAGTIWQTCQVDIVAVCHVDFLAGGFLAVKFVARFASGVSAALLKMAAFAMFAFKKVGWLALHCCMTHPIRLGDRIGHRQLVENGIRLN